MLLFTTNIDEEEESKYRSENALRNSSNVITTLSTIITVLLVLVAIIVSIVSFENFWVLSLVFVIYAVVNAVVCSIISDLLYGFGDLIESAKQIAENTCTKQ